jgi:hypothetical protein
LDAAKLLQTKTDSINKLDIVKAVSTADSSSYTHVIGALAKYDLKYDSAQRTIEKLIRDSAKKTINNIQEESPYVGICSDTSYNVSASIDHKDSLKLNLPICCYYANASNIFVNCGIAFRRNGNLVYVSGISKLATNYRMPGNSHTIFHPVIPQCSSDDSNIFIYVFGTYDNNNNTNRKPYLINDLMKFDINLNRRHLPSLAESKEVKRFFSQKDKSVSDFLGKFKIQL